MKEFIKEMQVRWSDLDINGHLRHSVYYDWGTFCRVQFLNAHKLTLDAMIKLNISPILFREECVFRKEIFLNDKVTVNLELLNAKKNFSRWTIQHTIFKNADIVSAILTVDGAWIDITKRKLAVPTDEVANVFNLMPRNKNFQWLD